MCKLVESPQQMCKLVENRDDLRILNDVEVFTDDYHEKPSIRVKQKTEERCQFNRRFPGTIVAVALNQKRLSAMERSHSKCVNLLRIEMICGFLTMSRSLRMVTMKSRPF
eukprot:444165_1